MKQQHIKSILTVLLMLWVLVFSVDSMFGIDWPNYTLHRIFVWCPTVLIGVYWLFFGGSDKSRKSD